MIKAIAIDDEPLALKVIENFCTKTENIILDKTFTSSKDGLNYCSNYPVDLLFLDIQMPSLTGIEFIKKLPQPALVIFTTAFDSYALEGYNLDVIDYLLKPFSYERFFKAIQKVQTQLTNQKTEQQIAEKSFIFVRADYSLLKIELNTILYIEGLDDYVKIHIENAKSIIARYTMKNILEQLPETQFIRIHRSFIIPRQRITQIKSKSLMIGNTELPIGASYETHLNLLKS
jgi:two-component system, LytTR family, response regulator